MQLYSEHKIGQERLEYDRNEWLRYGLNMMGMTNILQELLGYDRN